MDRNLLKQIYSLRNELKRNKIIIKNLEIFIENIMTFKGILIIPKILFSNFSSDIKILLSYLYNQYMNNKMFFGSNEYLSNQTGISLPLINSILKELESNDVVYNTIIKGTRYIGLSPIGLDNCLGVVDKKTPRCDWKDQDIVKISNILKLKGSYPCHCPNLENLCQEINNYDYVDLWDESVKSVVRFIRKK